MQYQFRLKDMTGTFTAMFNADTVDAAIDDAQAYCEATGREYLGLVWESPYE